ncbi:MAG: TonB-dependent receptor, partial [Candidatus Eremiobacteraeota bacterium]|nr:TonB-dependent receptor [Candidatus Eremiobacteraeota bacterium]
TGFYGGQTIDPHLLETVEVVKGPGVIADNINYAINGSVNFRTLEPTRKPAASFDLGIDRWGGQFSNYRFTGTTGDSHLGWAFDYSIDGTPGPLKSYNTYMQAFPGRSPAIGNPNLDPTINGQVPCPGKSCFGTTIPITGTNVYANSYTNLPFTYCCLPIDSTYSNKSELAKIRWRFSQNTSITASYVGQQSWYNDTGSQIYTASNIFFTPPAGYTGSLPAGSQIPCCGQAFPQYAVGSQSILQGEFRTTFKNTSVLARYYAGYVRTELDTPTQVPSSNTLNGLTLYGGVPFGASTTPTIFNGLPNSTVFSPNSSNSVFILDQLGGATLQINQTAGQNLYTLSYDVTGEKSTASVGFFLPNFANLLTAPPNYFIANFVPTGSRQNYRTLSGRALLTINPKLTVDLSDYLLNYTSTYSTDGGTTFQSSTHAYNAPRAAVTYRPNTDLIYRLSLGSSVAPPYIRQISSGTFPPNPNSLSNPQFFTQTVNSGNLAPETAFGYDLGADWRFGSPAMRRTGHDVLLSADGYLTYLKNQFYTTTTLTNPAYSSPLYPAFPPLPLYTTSTVNIGQAQYQGLELTARVAPPVGWGATLQGALIRAYVYNLPAGFYSQPGVPGASANLAVIPNINFQGSAATGGQNGIWTGSGQGRVPYAQGYGELNYHWASGIYANVGSTYYGNNNSYNWPAFFVLSASLRLPVWKNASFQISGDNLTGVHNSVLPCIDCGIPVVLANGQVGKSVGVNYGPATYRLNLHWDL